MKRRLDLALALAHRPRILFLDEPTTGLDIQSRTALWDEVARLAGEDGVTVFLTTQYLEEADALANRVGIIDHGNIVAEGTPAELKAEIGRPTVEVIPREDGDRERTAAVLRRFGEPAGAPPSAVAVRLAGGEAALAEVVRALDAEGIAIEHLQLHAPSLDDVFLAKTGRSLEGAEDEEEAAAPSPRRSLRSERRSRSRPLPRHPGRAARPPLGPAHAAPAGADRPRPDLPPLPPRGELGRAQRRDQPARLPDRLLPHLRPRGAIHAGRAVLGDELGHRPRPRHRDRLPQPPRADPAARRRPAARPARRRRRPRGRPGAPPTSSSASSPGPNSPPAPAARR